MLSRLVAITLLAIGLTSPLGAQRLAQRAGLSAPKPTTAAISSMSRRDVAPNDWLKGALIGSGVGVAVGYILGGIGREELHWTVFLSSIMICGIVGAMIGSGSKRL